ncbi:MAG TPA: thioredoxin-like domain-containing protein [Pirellulales bacterium]|jgi:thiol-disulfide isomerase/thioredoxin|nr:thioredoxin-like domain-containing protein [Pirellulales bacterium]
MRRRTNLALHFGWIVVVWMMVGVGEVRSQETAGIGVALGAESGAIVITQILPNTPVAANKSIKVGDRIIAVAQKDQPPASTKGLTLSEVVRLLRGAKGSMVRLTLVPAGADESLASVVSLVRGELTPLAFFGDGQLLLPGGRAPNVDLIGLSDGRAEKLLSDDDHQIVVIEFWSRWCGPCQKIIDDLQELLVRHPRWQGKVVLVAASADEHQQATAEYLKSKGWDKTRNVSVGSEALHAYHVGSLPTAYVIDQRGGIAAAGNHFDIAAVVDRLLESDEFLAEFRDLETACQKHFETSWKRTEPQLNAAKTQEDRDKINERFLGEVRKYLDPQLRKALALVEPHAAALVSAGPLKWILSDSEADSEIAQAALGLLIQHHLTHPQILDMGWYNRLSGKKWVETLLRAQVASDALPLARRPKQTMALAIYLKVAAELNRPRAGERQSEAIGLFTELARKYPDQEVAPGLTIGAMARGSLFAIQNLSIGKTAPDIQAEDLDGVTFKLSDYRGKVVVLSFWASWCIPCMELVPRERELVEQYQSRPFALVGVNADNDREELKPLLKEHRITWRSFWCGEKGSFGEIPVTWNVQGWPTAYLIDSAGVIRAKNVFGTALDKKIAELVAEAEKASPVPD